MPWVGPDAHLAEQTIFVNLIHAIPPRELPDGRLANNALIIVNGIELARQTVLQLKRLFPRTVRSLSSQRPDWLKGSCVAQEVELEQGQMKASGTAEVTVATIQTLIRGGRLDKFRPEQLKCIIVDEVRPL